MVFNVTNGPGKFDLMCAVFDVKQVQFHYRYHQESGGIRRIRLCIRSVHLCALMDGGKERAKWIILGLDVHNPSDNYFVIYDALRRKGLMLPFPAEHDSDGLTDDMKQWMRTMQNWMWGLYSGHHEPLSERNIQVLRFSLISGLAFMNGAEVEANSALLREWRRK